MFFSKQQKKRKRERKKERKNRQAKEIATHKRKKQ
jgi:hypothetical protein